MVNEFKVGDKVQYDNGKVKDTFIVHSISEYHLYSTSYNIPNYSKKYCKKINQDETN